MANQLNITPEDRALLRERMEIIVERVFKEGQGFRPLYDDESIDLMDRKIGELIESSIDTLIDPDGALDRIKDSIVLRGYDRKIYAIKEVREITGWGLKQAKEQVDKWYSDREEYLRRQEESQRFEF
jgi:hypothetical protein